MDESIDWYEKNLNANVIEAFKRIFSRRETRVGRLSRCPQRGGTIEE